MPTPAHALAESKSLFETNPIMAIGVLLSSIAAGARGEPNPATAMLAAAEKAGNAKDKRLLALLKLEQEERKIGLEGRKVNIAEAAEGRAATMGPVKLGQERVKLGKGQLELQLTRLEAAQKGVTSVGVPPSDDIVLGQFRAKVDFVLGNLQSALALTEEAFAGDAAQLQSVMRGFQSLARDFDGDGKVDIRLDDIVMLGNLAWPGTFDNRDTAVARSFAQDLSDTPFTLDDVQFTLRVPQAGDEALTGPIVRLIGPGGDELSFRRDDAMVNPLLARGYKVLPPVRVTSELVSPRDVARKAFAGFSGTAAGRFQEAHVVGRESALRMGQPLAQLADLLGKGVQTGALQPAIRALQAVADDLGVNLNRTAGRLGLNLGELAQKEDFIRLTAEVVVESFEKGKGNLNRQEVRLFEDTFAQLGRSERGNISAVSAMLAAQQIIVERGDAAIAAGTDLDKIGKVMAAKDNIQGRRFLKIKEKFEEEISGRFEAARSGQLTLDTPADVDRVSTEALRKFFAVPANADIYDSLPENVKDAIEDRLRKARQ